MRSKLAGLAAAIAVTVTAAPALACYNPCTSGLFGAYGGGSYGYDSGCAQQVSCGYGYQPSQYYYVNQGPTYTGPGTWAPPPVYRERTVIRYRPVYDGGAYANPVNYNSDGYYGQTGPAIYRPRFRHRPYGYQRPYYRPYRPAAQFYARPAVRYGYGARPMYHHQYRGPVRALN